MSIRRWWLLPLISFCFVLAGCSQEAALTGVPIETPQSAFDTPVSNEVDRHSETEHADAAHEEEEDTEGHTVHTHEAASPDVTPGAEAVGEQVDVYRTS